MISIGYQHVRKPKVTTNVGLVLGTFFAIFVPTWYLVLSKKLLYQLGLDIAKQNFHTNLVLVLLKSFHTNLGV
jgi:hypothetical protein